MTALACTCTQQSLPGSYLLSARHRDTDGRARQSLGRRHCDGQRVGPPPLCPRCQFRPCPPVLSHGPQGPRARHVHLCPAAPGSRAPAGKYKLDSNIVWSVIHINSNCILIWDPVVLRCHHSRTPGGSWHRAWARNQKLQEVGLVSSCAHLHEWMKLSVEDCSKCMWRGLVPRWVLCIDGERYGFYLHTQYQHSLCLLSWTWLWLWPPPPRACSVSGPPGSTLTRRCSPECPLHSSLLQLMHHAPPPPPHSVFLQLSTQC